MCEHKMGRQRKLQLEGEGQPVEGLGGGAYEEPRFSGQCWHCSTSSPT